MKPKNESKSDDKASKPEADGKLLERLTVKEVWPLLAVIATAVVTYLTTKANLQGRIEGLEARSKTAELFASYGERALVYHQINSLRILKDEFTALSTWAEKWKPPQFKTGKKFAQLGILPANTQPATVDVVVDRLDAPFADPMGRNLALLSSVVMNDRFRAMGDKDFVGKTALIYEALFEFNMAVGEDTLNTGAVLGRGSMPNFMDMKETDAKARIQRADKKIQEIKGLLTGMAESADSQRAKIEVQFTGKL